MTMNYPNIRELFCEYHEPLDNNTGFSRLKALIIDAVGKDSYYKNREYWEKNIEGCLIKIQQQGFKEGFLAAADELKKYR